MFSEPASTSAALAVSMSGPLDAGAELIPAPAADELSLLLLLLEPHALSTSAPIAVPVIRATRTVRRELTVKITPSETRPGSRGRGLRVTAFEASCHVGCSRNVTLVQRLKHRTALVPQTGQHGTQV